MVPQIFYRIQNAMNEAELDALPAISTSQYFDIANIENEPQREVDQLMFSIQKQILPIQEIIDIPLGGTPIDLAIKQKIKQVREFDQEMDLELLRAIDLYKEKKLSKFDVTLQHTQYDLKNLPFS